MALTPRSLLGEGIISLKDVDIVHILRISYIVLLIGQVILYQKTTGMQSVIQILSSQ